MTGRRYSLADAYMALDGKESLGAVASVLLEGEATPPFLEALARRLGAPAHGDDCEFQLVLVKRKNGRPVAPRKRAAAAALRLLVTERLINAEANGEDIESVVAALMKKTRRSRSWVYGIWSKRASSPE